MPLVPAAQKLTSPEVIATSGLSRCPEEAVDLDARVPAWFAAQRAGVSKQLLNYWRTKGKVAPDERGLYRLGDVLVVESQTRRSSTSSRGRRRDKQTWDTLNINSAGFPLAS
jgi:hypothetical protein